MADVFEMLGRAPQGGPVDVFEALDVAPTGESNKLLPRGLSVSELDKRPAQASNKVVMPYEGPRYNLLPKEPSTGRVESVYLDVQDELATEARRRSDEGGLGRAAAAGVIGGVERTVEGLANAVPLAVDSVTQGVINPLLARPTVDQAARGVVLPWDVASDAPAIGLMPRADMKHKLSEAVPKPLAAQKRWDDLKDGDEKMTWLVSNLAEQAPQMAGFVASVFNPSFSSSFLTSMGVMSAGSSYDEAVDKGLDPKAAAVAAWVDGGIEVLSEKLPLEVAHKFRKYIKAMPPEVGASFVGEALKRTGIGVGMLAAQAGTESAEEAVAQVGQNLSRRYIAGDTTVEWDDGLKDAMILGAAGGTVMGTPNAVLAATGKGRHDQAPTSKVEMLDAIHEQAANRGKTPRVPPAADVQTPSETQETGGALERPDVGVIDRSTGEIVPLATQPSGMVRDPVSGEMVPKGTERKPGVKGDPLAAPDEATLRENLLGVLWNAHQEGETLLAGKPSALLNAAAKVKAAGGELSQDRFRDLADRVAAIKKEKLAKSEYQQRMKGLVNEFAQQPAPVDGGAVKDSLTVEPAGVPVMITKKMGRRLLDLGYSSEDVRKLTPQQAHDLINSGSKKSDLPSAETATATETRPVQAPVAGRIEEATTHNTPHASAAVPTEPAQAHPEGSLNKGQDGQRPQASPLESQIAGPLFTPTHETVDGTPVRPYEDEPGVWEAEDGTIIEDKNAAPIITPEREPGAAATREKVAPPLQTLEAEAPTRNEHETARPDATVPEVYNEPVKQSEKFPIRQHGKKSVVVDGVVTKEDLDAVHRRLAAAGIKQKGLYHKAKGILQFDRWQEDILRKTLMGKPEKSPSTPSSSRESVPKRYSAADSNNKTADISYVDDGEFATFLPNTKAGEDAWRVMAEVDDGTGKVLSAHAQDVIDQLRKNGYTVSKGKTATSISDDKLLDELGLKSGAETTGKSKQTPEGEDDSHSEVEKVKKALSDAGISGKEMRDAIKDVRNGELTADEVVESLNGSAKKSTSDKADSDSGESNVPITSRGVESDRAATRDGDGSVSVPVRAGSAPDGSDAGAGGEVAGEARSTGRDHFPAADAGAAADGARGRSGLRGRSSRSAGDVAGGSDATRGHADSATGQSGAEHGGSGESARVVGKKRLAFEQKLKAQKKADGIKETKLADIDSIRETLPILLPEQQEDVLFAEERFNQADAHGVLFTNGTGTGKTFTGLGIAKRFHRRGKKNILIVVPSDKIARDWAESAKHFNLPLKQLESTKDNGGNGPVVTTYANLGTNKALAERDWDLIIPDEAHKLSQAESGSLTDAAYMVHGLAGHPQGVWAKARALLGDKLDAAKEEYETAKKALPQWKNGMSGDAMVAMRKAHEAFEDSDVAKRLKEVNKEYDDLTRALSQAPRETKVVFLSATPFAYHKNMRYADGYLFDASGFENKERKGGYNVAQGFDSFLQKHLGYEMKYGRLQRPDADVNQQLAERNLNKWLKDRKVLRGRRLEVDQDYSRGFVEIADGIGHRIDEGLRWAWEHHKEYPGLVGLINRHFNHNARIKLLEAVKAAGAVRRIRQHLSLGRKVVVFHSRKQGDIVHPFQPVGHTTDEKAVIAKFRQARPDLWNLDLGGLDTAVETLRAEFPEAVIFNGDVPKAQRAKNVSAFNTDGSGVDVIIVQRDAGKEGLSLHDTTGKHQRVLMDLGLPTKPTDAIQTEGRIYRTGVASDAIFEYFTTGQEYEKRTFAEAVAQRSSTAENLALGHEARDLLQAFVDAYNNAGGEAPGQHQGSGGKGSDRALQRGEASQFEQAKLAYYTRQKNTKNRREREGKDYYATPEPLGMKMVEWANPRPNESGLEPSAGHGAIARWFPDSTRNTFIEQSYSLQGELGMLAKGEVKHQDFEDLHVVNKYDFIVMNPPFGQGGSTAVKHLAQAFNHLRNGGRVVALIPRGGSADKKFDAWYENEQDAKMVADIGLPSITFERAGTGVSTHVVIIDRMDKKLREESPGGYARRFDIAADDTSELFDKLEDLSPMPDRPVVDAEKKGAPSYAIRSNAPDWFYSQMQQVLEKKLPNSGGVGDWRLMISNLAKKGEFKREELEWSGLIDWLQGQSGKITKRQVMDYLRDANIQVDEVERSDDQKWQRPSLDSDEAKEAWVVAKNQSDDIREEEEFLASIEDREFNEANVTRATRERFEREWNQGGWDDWLDPDATRDEEYGTNHSKYQLPGGDNYRELLLTLPGIGDSFVAEHHFKEKNVVAHIRFNERTDAEGKRVLFLEEVQSDWHQTGRKEGYKVIANTPEQAISILADREGVSTEEIEDKYGYSNPQEYLTLLGAGVPDAPFKTTWPMLAMKRMIRYAAENGFDRIAWTTGEQQAERYDLSKQISQIRYEKSSGGVGNEVNESIKDAGTLLAYDHAGNRVIDRYVHDDELADYIGKEAAEKMMKQPPVPGRVGGGTGGISRSLSGLDLKVGGEGMKGFYDQILPAAVNKYVKKWGAKVGETTFFHSLDEKGRDFDAHAIDITDAMRESAMAGQPLFAGRKLVAYNRLTHPNMAPVKGTVEGVRKAIAGTVLQWGRNRPEITVMQSVRDLPAHLRPEPGTPVFGVHDPASGAVYLVADNLGRAIDVKTILAHEAVGHYAMEEMLGDELMVDVIDHVQWLKDAGDKVVLELAAEVERDYGGLPPAQEAKEIIAKMAERRALKGELARFYGTIMTAVRKFMRKLGFQVLFSNKDLEALLANAERWLKQDGGKRTQRDNALWNPKLGEIDLVMGAGGAYGASRWATAHPEIGAELGELVAGAKLVEETPTRAVLKNEGVSFDLIRRGGRWRLTDATVASYAKRLMTRGYRLAHDFVIPETPEFDGNETGDLAYIPEAAGAKGVPVLPVRITAGKSFGSHRGFGMEHIGAEARSDTMREAPKFTDDRAENFVRQVAGVARSFDEIYEEASNRFVLRSRAMRQAIVVEERSDSERGDYLSVVTLVPSVKAVWGDPVWTGRGQLPSGSTQQAGAPGSLSTGQGRDTGVNPMGVQTEQFKFRTVEGRKQPTIVTKKKRRTFDENGGPNYAIRKTAQEVEQAQDKIADIAKNKVEEWFSKPKEARRMLMGWMTERQIKDTWKRVFGGDGGPLAAYTDLRQGMSAYVENRLHKVDKIDERWEEAAKDKAERLAIDDVMIDSTYYEIHPDQEYSPLLNIREAKEEIAEKRKQAVKLARLIQSTPGGAFIAMDFGKMPEKIKRLKRQMNNLLRDQTLKGEARRRARIEADKLKQQLDAMESLMSGPKNKNTERFAEINTLQQEIEYLEKRIQFEGKRRMAYPALAKKWQSLSPAAQKLIKDVEQSYRDQWDAMQQALEERLGDAITNGKARAEAITRIRQMFSQAMQKGPYFPLARFGDYVVTAIDPNGEYVREHAETENEQRHLMKEMEKQGFTEIKPSKLKDIKADDFKGAPGFAAEIFKLMDENGVHHLGLKDDIHQLTLKMMPELSYAKRSIHRRKTAGFSRDTRRAFAHTQFHGWNHIAKIKYGHKLQNQLDAMGDMIEAYRADEESPVTAETVNVATDVLNHMEERHETIMNPTGKPWTATAGNIGFVWLLGGSLGAGVINLTQTALVTYPMLAARYGPAKAAAALMRAAMQYARSPFKATTHESWVSLSRNMALPKDEREMIQRRIEDGTVDLTQSHWIAQLADTDIRHSASGEMRSGTKKGMRYLSAFFHNAEVMNREVTLLAAYRLAKEKGDANAEKTAQDITWDSHFDYSSANRALYMKNDFIKVATMMKNYSQHMLYTQFSRTAALFKDLPKAEKRQAFKELTGITAMHFLAAGALGMAPWIGEIFAAISLAWDDDDEPFDAKLEFQNWVFDNFGPTMGTAITKGVFNAMGVDMHSRVGLDTLLVRPPDRELEGRESWAYYGEQAAGPMFGIIGNLFAGVHTAIDGDVVRGIEQASPKFIKDFLKMGRYVNEGGVMTKQKEAVVDDLRMDELFMTAMGFTPARINERYERRGLIKNIEQQYKDRRATLLNQYYQAIKNRDIEGRQDAIDEIMQFNLANRYDHPYVMITSQDIRRSAMGKFKAGAMTEEGVYLSPRYRGLQEDVRTGAE